MDRGRIAIRAGGRQICIAGKVIAPAGSAPDTIIDIGAGEIHPGLINAHDHLHRNHYGRLGHPPYEDARQWGQDIQQRFRCEIAAGKEVPRREALLTGAWKNLFSGVTRVVHHDHWEKDFEDAFPIKVVRIGLIEDAHECEPDVSLADARVRSVHLAEGTSERARSELAQRKACGLLDARLLAVHCVGLDDAMIAELHASGAAVIWCPSSNLYLLGQTVRPELLAAGDVLLGSDSLLSGAGNLLDEIALARQIGYLPDDRLIEAVGSLAAKRLGIPPPDLASGRAADVIVLAKPLLECSAEDVVLVLVDGVPRIALPEIAPAFEALGYRGETRTLDGVTRWTYSGVD